MLTRIVEHAPGPRLVVALEEIRSYGVGPARALAAAGLPIIEIDGRSAGIDVEASRTRSTRTSPR